MITIDKTSPDGNVFCILGAAKSVQRQLRKEGIENETLNDVLANYTKMKYEQICEKLEDTGFFLFVDHNAEED